VEEYVSLLQQFSNKNIATPQVLLKRESKIIDRRIIINFNSEANSRRMPVNKAVSILNTLVKEIPGAEFICTGGLKEKTHIDSILQQVNTTSSIINKAGQTNNLRELIELIASGSAMLTTDSGPAHIANALGVPVVVLFGAGNEMNTGPYNKECSTVLRLGQLPCEPCVKNICKFGSPKCLEQMDENKIVQAVQNWLVH
jgi:ADP-heptose:LPS heptosyltransferase